MFGTSGIRGPVGEDVTADLALAVGRALAADAGRVVVGRDPRESGRFLADAVGAGLRECGTDIVRLGLAATPTVARSVAWRDADAGVAVTASHNPPEDNGLKLWQPSGQAFDEARRGAIAERVRAGSFDPASWDGSGGQSRWDGARERHAAAIAETVGGETPLAGLSVAVDLGNGAGGVSVNENTSNQLEQSGGPIQEAAKSMGGPILAIWNFVVQFIGYLFWPVTVLQSVNAPPRVTVLVGGAFSVMFLGAVIRLIRSSA